MSMGAELKSMFLKLIEIDHEFRYAVMGLLGFREILDRITRIDLEYRLAELEEHQYRLEEGFAELGEMIVGVGVFARAIASINQYSQH